MSLDAAYKCFVELSPPFCTLSRDEQLAVGGQLDALLDPLTDPDGNAPAGIAQLLVCVAEFLTCDIEEARAEAAQLLAAPRAALAAIPDDHPERNDMLIARWSITGDLALLRELHQATKRQDLRGEAARDVLVQLADNRHFTADLTKALAAN